MENKCKIYIYENIFRKPIILYETRRKLNRSKTTKRRQPIRRYIAHVSLFTVDNESNSLSRE